MTCKGICIRHKAQKPLGSGRYSMGQKRCQICELFIMWDGLWCPCCGYRLRTRPRNLKYKAKLRATNKVEESKILLSMRSRRKTITRKQQNNTLFSTNTTTTAAIKFKNKTFHNQLLVTILRRKIIEKQQDSGICEHVIY